MVVNNPKWKELGLATLAALNGAVGGESVPVNGIALPIGTTWAQFVAAYEAAPEPSNIILANELVTQTAGYNLDKAVSLYGSGSLSGFKILGEMSLFGSALQFQIRSSDTTFENFTIEHDRVSGGSSMRTIALMVLGTTNVTLRKLRFKGITSTCIISRDFNRTTQQNIGLKILDCTVDEWYESFFEHREGNLINALIDGNVGLTSSRHPNGGVQACTGVLINLEELAYPGLVENVVFHNNSLTVNPAIQNDDGAIGIAVRTNNSPDHRYNQLHFINNTFDGFKHGLTHLAGQPAGGSTLFPGLSAIYYNHNLFKTGGDPLCNIIGDGATGDYVFFIDNDMIWYNGGDVGLATTAGNATIITNPPNRLTGPQ